jgi:5-formyltetrahydrofolate cyclo-ligase
VATGWKDAGMEVGDSNPDRRRDDIASTDKAGLRAALAAGRRSMPAPARVRAASSLTAAVLTLPEILAARSVAAYLSIGTEPSTAEVLDALRARDVRVLLPVLRADLDLDWAIYENPAQLSPGPRGTSVPAGDRLGVDAVATVDVLVVPALAVGADGTRLGRGGGSYDRALARVPTGRPVVALLYDGELLPGVPADPHDQRVTVAVTPSGVHRFDAR